MKLEHFLGIVAVLLGGASLCIIEGCTTVSNAQYEIKTIATPPPTTTPKTTPKTTPTTASTNAVVIPLNELRAQADEVLSQYNVSSRDRLWVVFELADRLVEENQQEEAEKYISKGLIHYPWNLKYQMIYAEMLAKKGKQEIAEEKASLVYKYAETDDLIERAGKVLKKATLPNFEELNSLLGTNHCVVLVPFLGCDKWLIARVKNELAATLNVPVYVQAINVQYPPPRRDRRGAIINRFRRRLLENISDKEIVAVMNEMKITKDDLGDDNILKIWKFYLRRTGEGAEAQFDAYLKDAIGKDNQWDANELFSVLIAGVNPSRRINAAYIGIVPVDVYANYFNYLFGWGNNLGHIISYCRFSAVFNNETPNRDRLNKRMEMQCLASIGYVFGLPRCTDPTCARAYPNSLQEHDAKSGALCSECRDGFKKIFGQDK